MTSRLGINDIHYSMAVVNATDINLMALPTWAGIYPACKIGSAQPNEAVGAIWPHLVARLVSLGLITIGASDLRRRWVCSHQYYQLRIGRSSGPGDHRKDQSMTQLYSLSGTVLDIPAEGDCWIAPNAVLIGNVRLGREASIWFGAVLRADDDVIEIGERSNIQDGCVLHVDPGYPLTVGDNCTIGHKVMLHGCRIGSNTLIGMSSTILNGAQIGRNCLIGANTLITENKIIPDNSLVMGAPGRVVRELNEAGIKGLTTGADLYVKRWRRYQRELAMA